MQLKFVVRDLPEGGLRLTGEKAPGPTWVPEDGIEDLETVRLDLRVLRMEDEKVRIQGRFGYRSSRSVCARCLAPLVESRDCDVNWFLCPAKPGHRADWNETETYLDELPVGDLIRQEIICLREGRLLCSEACKGLCPECGGNRNAGSCECGKK